MRRVVLDASALMAFFEDRPGGEKVEELINQAVQGRGELLMSVVNWGEVYYATWRVKGAQAAREVLGEIAKLPIEVVNADGPLTKLAAELRAQRRLPYADCFAAALAKSRKALVAVSDADFSAVKDEISLLVL